MTGQRASYRPGTRDPVAGAERNPALRSKPPRQRVEAAPFGAFVRRAIRAYGRRVGDGEVDELADLLALRDDVDAAVAAAVAELIAEPHAHSWQRIADVLGITRQAAMKRWPDAHSSRRVGGQPARLR